MKQVDHIAARSRLLPKVVKVSLAAAAGVGLGLYFHAGSLSGARSSWFDTELSWGGLELAPVVQADPTFNERVRGGAGQRGEGEVFLNGVVVSGANGASGAYFGSPGGAAQLYLIGQELPGGGRLVGVYPDKVIIERNGVEVPLELHARLAAGSLVSPAYSGEAGANGNGVPPMQVDPLRESQSFPVDLMRVQPAYSNGAFRGLRVYPGREGTRFAAAGLEPGDLVLALDGQPVERRLAELDVALRSDRGQAVVLSVERAGREVSIAVDPLNIASRLRDVEHSAPPAGTSSSTGRPGLDPGNWGYGRPD
jgi:type II secretion system protein C